jgi:hypothetical protein
MTKLKRVLCGTMCLAMAGSMLTACGDDSSSSGTNVKEVKQNKEGNEESKNTIKIYVWNQEFQGLFRRYYPEYDAVKSNYDTEKHEKKDTGDDFLKDGKKVVWVVNDNQGNNYQDKLDAALKAQADSEDKVDMFLIEADYALKYVNSGYTKDLSKIGITDSDTAQMYDYTKQVATAEDGTLRAVSWQATPGLFAYRRDIAKDVLGTDDPAEVQAALSDWTKFDEVAAKMNEKGYKMLSGFDDSYRVFSNNVSKPWVDENKKIVVDDALMQWVDQTKNYTDKGYNNKTSLWSDPWAADQGPTGKVFGFFYSTWGINFTLKGNSLETPVDKGGEEKVGNGIYGQYAVCEGPAAYFWGGTWLCCAAGSDNEDTVADIMKKMTCDKDIATQITKDTQDYTNNKEAMDALAASDYASDFLGGQNHIALFASAAPNIKMDKTTAYDQGLNEAFQEAFKDYFNGNATKDEALENFYKAALEKYPTLSK